MDVFRQILKQPGNHLPPGLLPREEMESLHCLLGSLLGRKTGPLLPPGPGRLCGLLQVSHRLFAPVPGVTAHRRSPPEAARLLLPIILMASG